MNTKLMERVADQITEEPEHFHMAWYFQPDRINPTPLTAEPGVGETWADVFIARAGVESCDTTACIAGWAALLSSPTEVQAVIDSNAFAFPTPSDIGAALLGLPYVDASKLFHSQHLDAEGAADILRWLAIQDEFTPEVSVELWERCRP